MSYIIHEELLGIVADLKYAWDNNDIGMARRVIDRDLATVYVFIKELELHGYEAFKELIEQYNLGKEIDASFDTAEDAK